MCFNQGLGCFDTSLFLVSKGSGVGLGVLVSAVVFHPFLFSLILSCRHPRGRRRISLLASDKLILHSSGIALRRVACVRLRSRNCRPTTKELRKGVIRSTHSVSAEYYLNPRLEPRGSSNCPQNTLSPVVLNGSVPRMSTLLLAAAFPVLVHSTGIRNGSSGLAR